MNDRTKAFLAIFFGALLGGAVTTVTKIGLINFPPLTFAFLRFLIASVVILPLFIKKYKFSIRQFRDLMPFTLFATLNIILFIFGIKSTTATIGQLLYAATPFLTGLMLYILFGEKLSVRRNLGIVIGFVGVAIVILLPLLEKGGRFSGDLTGNLLIAAGVVSWSLYMVFSKKHVKNQSPFLINSVFIFVTTLILLPFFFFDIIRDHSWITGINMSSALSVVYVAVFGTVLSYLLNQYAIKHGGSVFAATSFYLLPVFAFFSAFILLGEGLTFGLIAGGVLALFGVFLVTSK